MEESLFVLPDSAPLKSEGQVFWQAPSNIALIKYWGKKPNQIPANPSLSFTLNSSRTTTKVSYTPLAERSSDFSFDFIFEGDKNDAFRPKIGLFLERIYPFLPFLKDFHFTIESSNSFPHSSGIASSASAFAALALCFVEMEKLMNPAMTEEYFYQKASFIERLGSGSACRSISGPIMSWGKHAELTESSDQYATAFPYEVAPVFRTYRDAILLVDKGKKSVSSTEGHQLMEGHGFAESRFLQAHDNLSRLKDILREGDLKKFMEIVESEALTLHAMMMTSIPYYLLMKPNTLKIIESIWQYRRDTGANVCFTLDAGANVHLLFPKAEEEVTYQFIESELLDLCEDREFLKDQVGAGASRL